MTELAGFILDIDGVVLQGSELVAGAKDAVAWLRREGYPFRFLTNTSRKSRRSVVASLGSTGLVVDAEEVVSTTGVAAEWLRRRGLSRLHLLVAEDAREDFADFVQTDDGPDAVVVGDMGRRFDFDVLNRGFLSLHGGAELVALQRNRYWYSEDGLAMDAGAFVAALEYASGRQAELIGKPSRQYFDAAVEALSVPRERVVMVGDDPETDIRGARDAGLLTMLVETGKHSAADDLHVEPDWILTSIAELPGLVTSS